MNPLAESPASTEERVLTSERLKRLEEGQIRLEGIASRSESALERLVELGEHRERRAEAAEQWEREQAAQRGTWFRSVVASVANREVLVPMVTALAALATGAGAMWQFQPRPPSAPAAISAPAPAHSSSGAELGPKDGAE